MKLLTERRMRILEILRENLKNPQPQVVKTEHISAQLQMDVKETRYLLLQMEQAGEIQSNMEVNYSLITPAGLSRVTSAACLAGSN